MEQNRDNSKKHLLMEDRKYWENPKDYALAKLNANGKEYYGIYTVRPKLMMLISDDIEYVNKLAGKMIENGVIVYNSFEELWDVYNKEK